MSENEHVAAIRKIFESGVIDYQPATPEAMENACYVITPCWQARESVDHAESLAAQLAEAEARAQAAEEDRERWIDTAYDHEQRQWKAEDRLAEAEARAGRLRAFAEDMAWYVPQQDWEETARQKLNYGDCRRYVEIMSDAGDLPDTDGDSE
jgi:hypothetical protein